jgi:hypothetical protein
MPGGGIFFNRKKTGLKKIVAHNCYLVNLASPDADVRNLNILRSLLDAHSPLMEECHEGSHALRKTGRG